jgi:hypothetical protein
MPRKSKIVKKPEPEIEQQDVEDVFEPDINEPQEVDEPQEVEEPQPEIKESKEEKKKAKSYYKPKGNKSITSSQNFAKARQAKIEKLRQQKLQKQNIQEIELPDDESEEEYEDDYDDPEYNKAWLIEQISKKPPPLKRNQYYNPYFQPYPPPYPGGLTQPEDINSKFEQLTEMIKVLATNQQKPKPKAPKKKNVLQIVQSPPTIIQQPAPTAPEQKLVDMNAFKFKP